MEEAYLGCWRRVGRGRGHADFDEGVEAGWYRTLSKGAGRSFDHHHGDGQVVSGATRDQLRNHLRAREQVIQQSGITRCCERDSQ